MFRLKTGIFLPSLREPFKVALRTAARLGADAVEIDGRGELRPEEMSDTALRQLRKSLEDLKLKVCAVRFQTRRGYGHTDDLDRRVEATKRAMRFARSLGADVVVNHLGHIPEEDAAARSLLLQALTDLGHWGQRVGATLAARTGAENADVLQRLLAELPEGFLGLDLDPGALVLHGHSPQEVAERLGAHVLHVHARDGVRDLSGEGGQEVPLGRGAVDFPELLGALEQHDYRGYLTVERQQCDDPEREIGQALQFLRSL